MTRRVGSQIYSARARWISDIQRDAFTDREAALTLHLPSDCESMLLRAITAAALPIPCTLKPLTQTLLSTIQSEVRPVPDLQVLGTHWLRCEGLRPPVVAAVTE